MCDNGGFIIVSIVAIVFIVIVLVFVFFAWNSSRCVREVVDDDRPPKPRFEFPDTGGFWTFCVRSYPLRADEFNKIDAEGWTFVNCTSEQETYYPNCGPEAPKMTRTVWHYVFKKKTEVV
jgi:hypothetical protein